MARLRLKQNTNLFASTTNGVKAQILPNLPYFSQPPLTSPLTPWWLIFPHFYVRANQRSRGSSDFFQKPLGSKTARLVHRGAEYNAIKLLPCRCKGEHGELVLVWLKCMLFQRQRRFVNCKVCPSITAFQADDRVSLLVAECVT